VKGSGIVEREMSRFLEEPASIRNAARVIVLATAVVVAAGGVAMWLLDHSEYPNPWVGMWWALQTVTTVGYGDVTPRNVSGRIIASAVMLWGIAFVTILIAAITSTFITRASRERRREPSEDVAPEEGSLQAQLDDLAARLDRIEKLLSRPTS
jgi:voltage-gated potassium channel